MPVLAKVLTPTSVDGGTVTSPPVTADPVVTVWGGQALTGPRLTLTTNDGTIFDLGDPNRLLAMLGRKGFDAPTYDARVVETPLVDGEIFRGARALPRDMVLPIYLRADNRADFLVAKRGLLSKLSPRNGMVTLSVAEPDGSRRSLGCYFTGRGAEGDMSRDQQGLQWVKYQLELRAPSPYWEGEEIGVTFAGGNSDTFFPFLPLSVKTGTSFGDVEIFNPGDVPAYPLWRIEGPSTGFALRNGSDTQIAFNQTLLTGQQIIINTHPHQLLITDGEGANRWTGVAEGSVLWAIQPGDETISVSVNGSSEASKVSLTFRPRYETA